jgi:membrane protein DedA with SNARE-associated domain
MDLFAIVGLAGLLLIKEAGVPIPIPGDLLVIGAGVASSGNPATAVIALVAILIAGYVGGAVQFLLVRGGLRRAVLALLARFGVSQARIDALANRLRNGGARGVAIARATPGVRVPAIAASGLAALSFRPFLAGLVTGNSLFVGGHFLLGFVIGPPAVSFLEKQGLALTVGAFVLLAVIGAVGWLLLRRSRRAATFAAWADAACPACLTLAVIGRERGADI